MSHYTLLSDRRFPLLSAERPCFSGEVQNLSVPASQWQQIMHGQPTYLGESTHETSYPNCWATPCSQGTEWPVCAVPQPPYRSVGENITSGFSTPSEYPESSQRTILPPSPPAINPPILPLNPYKNDLPRSPSQSPDYGDKCWGDDLYTQEETSVSRHASLPTPAPPSVKVEPDDADDCFIMELAAPQSASVSQSLAPPTEVPLRATQASKEMRRMMGVFRLNPFAMHSGAGRGVVPSSWNGGEARPLEEEPIIFEFQLELDDVLESPKEDLRAFSPDFELEGGHDEGEKGEWTEYGSESVFPPTPTWELEYPPGEELVASAEYDSTALSARCSARPHPSPHPNLRKTMYMAHQQHHASSSSSNSSVDMNHTRLDRLPSEPSWSHSGYNASPRSTTYVDSPDCDITGLPSLVAMNRRWSLPDTSINAPFLM